MLFGCLFSFRFSTQAGSVLDGQIDRVLYPFVLISLFPYFSKPWQWHYCLFLKNCQACHCHHLPKIENGFEFHQIDPWDIYLLFFLFSLEERQRAEKRAREEKGHKFSPRWFELTEEVTSTPWGDLEIYQYNGKYAEHRAAADNSASVVDDVDVKSIEFNPWQYGDLATE